MPRFYFDFRQGGKLQHDDVGVEFPSAEQAYLAAMDAVRDMWSELLNKRQDPRACSFEIRGESGGVLFEIPFSEVLDVCVGARPPSVTLESSLRDARATHARANKLRQELHDEFLKTPAAICAKPSS